MIINKLIARLDKNLPLINLLEEKITSYECNRQDFRSNWWLINRKCKHISKIVIDDDKKVSTLRQLVKTYYNLSIEFTF